MFSRVLSQAGSLQIVGVEFARSALLLFIPLLCGIAWWIAQGSLSSGRGRVHTFRLVLRCIVTTLLVFALAEPSIKWGAKDVAVMVVRDVSRSVPPETQTQVDDFLKASLHKKTSTDRIGLVTAASDAYVQTLPSTTRNPSEIGHIGDVNATNLEEAIRLARALVPSDTAGRILLISDGNQTSGSLAAAVQSASIDRVPIDVATIEYDRTSMIMVQDVVVPSWARQNDTINAKVVIDAGREASGRLSLLLNGMLIDLDPQSTSDSTNVHLSRGLNVFSVPLRLSGAPVHEFKAVFEPTTRAAGQPDPRDVPELLSATSITFTDARGRVLVVTEDERAHTPFVQAIQSQEITAEVRSAGSVALSLNDLLAYDAVVLANENASNFSLAQQKNLVKYVRDVGGGILILGGPESYGAGGWIGSALAEVMPVSLDPPQKRQMPRGALALIIDRSGSMTTWVPGTQVTQQEIANQAAILGINALSRLDQVAVIAFDDVATTVVPLTTCTKANEIVTQVRSISPGGGTNLFPAMDAAMVELAKSDAGIKHIIILTDGKTIGEPSDGLAKAAALARKGITISTVSIGDGSNDDLLKQIARTAGGKSYPVKSANAIAVLPQIFIKEAQTIRRALIWEGPAFSPKVDLSNDALRGISTPLPGISGYVVTAERGGLATVALRGPEGDPILAHWQHGLGRVTAYTSDATTRWNASWTTWQSYAAFWKQQLQRTMRASGDPNSRINIEPHGDHSKVVVELFDERGERLNFANIEGRILHPESDSRTSSDIDTIRLEQVGPGRYEAEVAVQESGVHLLSLLYNAPTAMDTTGKSGTRNGSLRAAVVRRGGNELANPTPSTEMLWNAARETNGRIYRLDTSGADLWVRDHLVMPTTSVPIWKLCALLGIFLFVTDVAARRIVLEPERWKKWTLGLFATAQSSGSASLATLSAAKKRVTVSAQRERSQNDVVPTERNETPITKEPVSPETFATTKPAHRAAQKPSAPQPQSTGDMMQRLRDAKKRSMNDT